jgi:hypothetical protein
MPANMHEFEPGAVAVQGRDCPPAGIDPGIAVPPVCGGRTPVIPPPGTPGGNPNIISK